MKDITNKIIQKIKTFLPGSEAWAVIADPKRTIGEPIRFIAHNVIINKIVIERDPDDFDIIITFDCTYTGFHTNNIFKTKRAACKKAEYLTILNAKVNL